MAFGSQGDTRERDKSSALRRSSAKFWTILSENNARIATEKAAVRPGPVPPAPEIAGQRCGTSGRACSAPRKANPGKMLVEILTSP